MSDELAYQIWLGMMFGLCWLSGAICALWFAWLTGFPRRR